MGKYKQKHKRKQRDESDGENDAVLRKSRANLTGIWAAGYP